MESAEAVARLYGVGHDFEGCDGEGSLHGWEVK
jgi:hypothetical protein